MNIYLIGYRCTGKTSVGKFLAKRLGRLFLDTDLELVKEQGLKISEIVHAQGWNVFREMEKAVIKRISTLDDTVVATGGGVVLDDNNVKHMKAGGVMIWLKASPKTIQERMLQDKTTEDFRPSLTSKDLTEEIRETLSTRNPYYEDAMDFFIDTDAVDIEMVSNMIIKKLGEIEPKK